MDNKLIKFYLLVVSLLLNGFSLSYSQEAVWNDNGETIYLNFSGNSQVEIEGSQNQMYVADQLFVPNGLTPWFNVYVALNDSSSSNFTFDRTCGTNLITKQIAIFRSMFARKECQTLSFMISITQEILLHRLMLRLEPSSSRDITFWSPLKMKMDKLAPQKHFPLPFTF